MERANHRAPLKGITRQQLDRLRYRPDGRKELIMTKTEQRIIIERFDEASEVMLHYHKKLREEGSEHQHEYDIACAEYRAIREIMSALNIKY